MIPEKAKTFELVYNLELKQFKINLSTYYRIGSNVIDWVKLPDSPKWQSKNLADINALGSDIDLQYDFRNSFIRLIKLDYSYLTINKKATTFDSKYALDYLKHKLILTLQHKIIGNLSALWKAGYYERSGNYSDFVSNSLIDYKPYTMLDMRILWSTEHFNLYIDANNLLSANYADFGGISQPGRNFRLGITYEL